jgi:hypothetical protein
MNVHVRYIFDTKESKVASKDKKAKKSESKSQTEKQVICRLQVWELFYSLVTAKVVHVK